MKHLLFAFAALLLLLSCNDGTTNTTGTNENSAIAEHNAENTKKVYNAIQTGDVTGIDTLFTEDVVDHNAGPQGQDVRGRDSVIAMLREIHTYFDGLNLEMLYHATSPDGQYHYATVRMTGTAKQNPWGMPVGMKMDDTSVDVIKLRDGKAQEHWGFLSWEDINEMMKGMSGGGNQPSGGNKPAGGDTSQR